jgi:putative oxidoreductase
MTDSVLMVGRILMSAIFIFGGLTKLIGAAASQAMMAKYGLPVPMLAWAITVIIELGGGLTLLFGVATRPTATVLGFWCIATALVAHTNFADPNMRGHFMKNVAMAGGFAYVAVFGAGAYSIDAWRKRRSSA